MAKNEDTPAPTWTTYHANSKAFPVDPKLDAVMVTHQGKTSVLGYSHSRAWHAAMAEATK
jgi:hypothetical protein